MSFLRTLSVVAVSGLLCVALCAPRVSASCSVLLGDARKSDYPDIANQGSGQTLQVFGNFSAPSTIESFDTFVFKYLVPEQAGYVTPNRLLFAVYSDEASPALLAVSNLATILPNVAGDQTLTANIASSTLDMQPNTNYLLAVWNELDYVSYVDPYADLPLEVNSPIDISQLGFPNPLYTPFQAYNYQYPMTYQGCNGANGLGDPVFTGFHGQHFAVKGEKNRAYNVLSLPSLQLNTRFVPLSKGQAMNGTEQSSVRARQSKLIKALQATHETELPSTVAWSHRGLYMGETGVQVSGHRLLVQPGAYSTGFVSVMLDGAELPVSSVPVELLDGSSITRSSSSVVQVSNAQVQFTLVNSDHFLNIHSAMLKVDASTLGDHVDGLLGQTIADTFRVEKTAAFQQHLEEDFVLAEGEDVFSTAFAHNQYKTVAGAN